MTPLYHSNQPFPQTSGIYRITCTINGKFYIGSALDLRVRQRQHLSDLRRNKHHSITLQRAWNKYTEEAFIFEVLELTLPPFLLEREQYWLDKLKPFNPKNGYNIAHNAHSRLGLKASAETRKKIGQASKGHTTSHETREKMRQAQLGRKFSAESLKKRSQTRTGMKHTPETREKLRQINLGKGKGKKLSPEHIEKVRQANLGRKHTPEQRERNRDRNRVNMKTLIVTDPNGIEHTVTGIRQFAKEHSLSPSHLIEVAQGKQRTHKGYKAR